MTPAGLEAYLAAELNAFPCKASLLAADLMSRAVLHAVEPEVRVASASVIKVPVLLAALEQVRRGRLSLDQRITVPAGAVLEDTEVFEQGAGAYTLWELCYWMIVESDNTAANVLIRLLGFEAVNRYSASLGLTCTVLEREMLDFAAIGAGRDNYTSAADQLRLYRALCLGDILTPALRETALDILRRQRCMDCLLRYIPDNVAVAHKTGGLDFLAHDAGVFFTERPFFLGIFTWDGPSPEGDKRQRMLIGRLGKAVFDTYSDSNAVKRM